MHLNQGAELVWVLYPRQGWVHVYEPGPQLSVVAGASGVLEGGDVLPGFRLPLAELWGSGA